MVRASKAKANELTPVEFCKLENLEEIIGRNRDGFVAAGAALVQIRDEKLYRVTHKTFAEYCREKWDLSKSRVYQLIESAALAVEMSTLVDKPPTTEREARPLVAVPAPDRPAVLERAGELAKEEGKPRAARHVEEAAREIAPKPAEVKEPEPAIDPKKHGEKTNFSLALKLLDEVREVLNLSENPKLAQSYKTWRSLCVLLEDAKRKAGAK